MQIKVKHSEKFVEQIPVVEPREQVSPLLLRVIKLTIIILSVVGAGVIIVLQTLDWMKNSQWFRLTAITVEGNYSVNQKEIASLVMISDNANLINVPIKNMQARIEAHPWIRKATVHRMFPSALKIKIEERVPVAMILGKHSFWVDDEGVVLPQQKNIKVYDVPCITGIPDLGGKPGEKIASASLSTSLDILRNLRSIDIGMWFKISELCWEDGPSCIIYMYDQAIPIRIPKEGSLHERVYILNQFLQYAESENKLQDIAFIDVTYEGQLITKNHK